MHKEIILLLQHWKQVNDRQTNPSDVIFDERGYILFTKLVIVVTDIGF